MLLLFLTWKHDDCFIPQLGQHLESSKTPSLKPEDKEDRQTNRQTETDRSFADVQGFSWTEIYFGHFVQAAPTLFGHLKFF